MMKFGNNCIKSKSKLVTNSQNPLNILTAVYVSFRVKAWFSGNRN